MFPHVFVHDPPTRGPLNYAAEIDGDTSKLRVQGPVRWTESMAADMQPIDDAFLLLCTATVNIRLELPEHIIPASDFLYIIMLK